jgi:hypothetical protein
MKELKKSGQTLRAEYRINEILKNDSKGLDFSRDVI